MTLKELLESNEKAQKQLDLLSHEEQINLLKNSKKSVFTFHMKDGREIISGDSESTQDEMRLFFEQYPQDGCDHIEFHK